MDELIEMYSTVNDANISTRKDCWDAAIQADLSAAAGYFIGVGFGILVPGANTAIATTVAWASSWASAMAGFICNTSGGGDEEEGPLETGSGGGSW